MTEKLFLSRFSGAILDKDGQKVENQTLGEWSDSAALQEEVTVGKITFKRIR